MSIAAGLLPLSFSLRASGRTLFRKCSNRSSCLPTGTPLNTRLYSPSNTIRAFSLSQSCKDLEQERPDLPAKDKTPQGIGKRKPHRSSLRRVAVEAERSRDASKGGVVKRSVAEHETAVKVVTAYCAAEQYDIPTVSKILKSVGYEVDPFRTGLYPQVVHVQFPSLSGSQDGGSNSQKPGDVFVFPSGTLVAWDVSEDTMMTLISRGLMPAAVSSHLGALETEDLEFVESSASDKSTVVGERITLGTERNSPADPEHGNWEASEETEHDPHPEAGLTLAKIAFSSGLARSAKLAVLETALDRYFESTRTIPSLMSKGSKLPFTRSFILRKTGELLDVRAQLNLYSELTDSLPDLFWESRHELGLEGYFDKVGNALDVNIRIRTLNQKMDYAQEIATVLRERLSEKHGLLLEWLIIALISIEVVFGIMELYRRQMEHYDGESTENLLREYLRKQLKEEAS